ncbi:MAG TPA: serine protease [Prosthecobacter sp.]
MLLSPSRVWISALLTTLVSGCTSASRPSEQGMWSTYAIATQKGDATCFVVRDPRTVTAGDEGAVVFTSTHVLESIGDGPVVVSLRVRDEGSGEARVVMLGFVPPKARGKNVFYVRHPRHDLAAFSLHIPPEHSWLLKTHSCLRTGSILRKGRLLRTGDEVSFLGYPEVLPGTGGAFPILRSGRVASYPVGTSQSGGRFLINADVYPGDSGAPVFLAAEKRLLRLAGMIIQRIGPTSTSFSHLAVAVDADAIRETLELLVAGQRTSIPVETAGRAIVNPPFSIP